MTTITIAHKLATIRRADSVIYLDRCRSMAQGMFEEVRKRCRGSIIKRTCSGRETTGHRAMTRKRTPSPRKPGTRSMEVALRPLIEHFSHPAS